MYMQYWQFLRPRLFNYYFCNITREAISIGRLHYSSCAIILWKLTFIVDRKMRTASRGKGTPSNVATRSVDLIIRLHSSLVTSDTSSGGKDYRPCKFIMFILLLGYWDFNSANKHCLICIMYYIHYIQFYVLYTCKNNHCHQVTTYLQ